MDPCDDECCYICLGEPGSGPDELHRPCKCPRMAHLRCLARWQLQVAGTREEKHCRFCNDELPDWRRILLNADGTRHTPVMTVMVNGETRHIKVGSGPGARERFEDELRVLFDIPPGVPVNMTFDCRVPDTGSPITLSGSEAFDAAVHCACTCPVTRLTKDTLTTALDARPGPSTSAVPALGGSSIPAARRDRHATAPYESVPSRPPCQETLAASPP